VVYCRYDNEESEMDQKEVDRLKIKIKEKKPFYLFPFTIKIERRK